MKKPTFFERLQAIIAVASFVVGTIIASICLFAIQPIGEIANTAISIVSEFLILCGACLGLDLAFNNKIKKLREELGNEK